MLSSLGPYIACLHFRTPNNNFHRDRADAIRVQVKGKSHVNMNIRQFVLFGIIS